MRDVANWRPVLRAGAFVTAATLIVNLASFAQEAFIAKQYGSGAALDAYVFGASIIMFVSGVVGNAFGAAIVPAYLNAHENNGRAVSQTILGVATKYAVLFLTTVMVFAVAAAPLYLPVLAPRFDIFRQSLTLRTLIVMSPIVVVSSLAQAWASLLNSKGHFFVANLAGGARPMVVIAVLLLAPRSSVVTLAAAVMIGHVAAGSILGLSLRRDDIDVLPGRGTWGPELRRAREQYWALAGGAFLTSTMGITDQAVASYFPAGSIASLNYAYKLCALPSGVAIAVIGAILLPRFAVLGAQRNVEGLRALLVQSLVIAMASGAIVAGVIAVAAEAIVQIAFARGAFGSSEVATVATLFRATALQIPFIVAGTILTRFLVATQNYEKAWIGLIVSPVINLGLDVVLGRKFGVVGIVWSSMAVSVYSCVYFVALARRAFNRLSVEVVATE